MKADRSYQCFLCDIPKGSAAIIEEIRLPKLFGDYLMRIGIEPGTVIRVSRESPLGGPHIYLVQGTEIAIRRETARQIVVRVTDFPGAEDA